MAAAVGDEEREMVGADDTGGGIMSPIDTPTGDTPAAHGDERFPYDARPYRPLPPEEHPLERLAGRGQTELTPMGCGWLAWALLAVLGAITLVALGGYLFSLLR